jgi:hypothetical protein
VSTFTHGPWKVSRPAELMNVFNDLGGSVLGLVVCAAAALVAAVYILFLITFLGARFFSDELSYGVPLLLIY